MSIRKTLFLLFLYLLLAWTVVILLSPRELDMVVNRGLLWSAIGIGGLLLWFILQPVFGWWRHRTRQAKAAPSAPPVVQRQPNAEGSELASLIAEADRLLQGAPEMANQSIRDLPIYLLIGPVGSGKTSLIHNAGIDARLLAGQVLGAGTPVSETRVANIWLANKCIFLEVSGRIFGGDQAGFAEFLRMLKPPHESTGWRRFWFGPADHLRLRGVVLCCDIRAFSGNIDRATLEKSAAIVRDRLFTIAEIFRMRCPVYAMFSRADTISYFAEFFDRLPESEAGQPLGVLINAEDAASRSDEGPSAEGQFKKLNREFNNVYLCLSARRLINLSYEPTASRKPAIYEFPREFKRMRTPLVQYLLDALKPDPLRLSPDLRGFFFCGTRRVEAASGASSETNAGHIPQREGSNDATRIFRQDATIFSGDSVVLSRTPGGVVERAVFTKDFLREILPKDRPPVIVSMTDPRLDRNWKVALASAAAAVLVLSSLWTVSWAGNRSLIEDAELNSKDSGGRGRELSVESLRALDNLRGLLVDKLDRPRPLSMNWGLYTGGEIQKAVRETYFSRLQQLLLNDANDHLAKQLAHAGVGSEADSYDVVLGRLKTHLSVTGSRCPLDQGVVSSNLKQAIVETHQGLHSQRRELADQQIDYYVGVLPQGNPVQLRADSGADEHARTYLTSVTGPGRLYSDIMAQVASSTSRIAVIEKVPGYKQVIQAQDYVSFEFTREGQAKFEEIAQKSLSTPHVSDVCVLGTSLGKAALASREQISEVRSMYYRKYADYWKKFLEQTSVRRYERIEDVPRKLETLAGETPVLMVFLRFVSAQTTFSTRKTGVGEEIAKDAAKEASDGLVNRLGFGNAKQKAQKAADAVESQRGAEFGPVQVNAIFDPVHLTIGGDSEILVNDRNRAYVYGLRGIKQSFETYINNPPHLSTPPTEANASVGPLAQSIEAAKVAQQSLADNFHQDTEGVSVRLKLILLQPITEAEPWIPKPKVIEPPDPNKALTKLCNEIKGTTSKYPFSDHAKEDVTIEEFSTLLAPETGRIWAFEKGLLNDVVIERGGRWIPSPDAKRKVDQGMLDFLNHAQYLTSAFFAAGVQRPSLRYTLRPVEGDTVKVKLAIDGQVLDATDTPLQKEFEWPARGGEGAECNAFVPGFQSVCGSYTGTWAVFRLFAQAEYREPGKNIITWTKALAPDGRIQHFSPVRVEIVTDPGRSSVFQPHFFDGLRPCPSQAVMP